MTRVTMIRIAALAAFAVVAAGCAGSAADPLEATPEATSDVSVVDNAFEPVAVTVPVGTEVTWTWEGSADHNVVAEDDAFQSDTQSDGTFSHTFDEAGTYPYRCTLHSGMKGVVIVGDDGASEG